MAGLLAPLVAAKRNMTLVGFYHIPLASLIMGFSMALPVGRLTALVPLEGLGKGGILQRGRILKGLAVRRLGIIVIFAVATILAFCESFFNISPVIFLAISTLCCSVLIGVGMQGLICAGYADRKWILFAAIVMGVLAIVTLLLATKYFQTFASLGSGYARLLTEAAKMYILGATTVAIFFLMALHRTPYGGTKLTAHSTGHRRKASLTGLTVLLKAGLLCATMGLDIFLGARFIVDAILYGRFATRPYALLREGFALDLSEIEPAVITHKTENRIELLVNELSIVADNCNADDSNGFAVLVVHFGYRDIEPALKPANEALDYTPLAL